MPNDEPTGSRKWLWLLLGLLALLIALGAVAFFGGFFGSDKAPVDTSNEFFTQIDSGNFAEAAEFLDIGCRKITEADLQRTFSGSTIDYDLSSVSTQDGEATVSGDFTLNGTMQTVYVLLEETNDDWGICDVKLEG